MKILALEFSSLRRSAALLQIVGGEAQLLSVIEDEPSPNARLGSPFQLIKDALEKTQAEEIGGLVIGLGPGSYTGIRFALAIAQGWHLAHQTPVAGVSSADVIAYKAARWHGFRGEAEVVIDA